MGGHDYRYLQLRDSYSLSDVRDMITDHELLQQLEDIQTKIEFSLYHCNRGLVFGVMKQMNITPQSLAKRKLDMDEVFDYGMDGLMLAIKGYDPTRAKLSTYAWPLIRQRILGLFKREDTQKRKGRRKARSLSDLVGEDAELVDFIEDTSSKEPTQEVIHVETQNKVKSMLSKLTEREKDIIIRHFGLFDYNKETLEDIAKLHNLSRQRINQIEQTALKKLSYHSDAKILKKAFFNEI